MEVGDFRAILPRFSKNAMEKNEALVDLLRTVAWERDATPGQVALAWILAQKPWIVPIPGTKKLARFDENSAAADLVLTAEDVAMLNTASQAIPIEGARYPDKWMAMIGR